MANLLSNTTIGGYQSIHTGNIGSYALTSITSGQVTTALGFTPYNATNPSAYITSSNNYYYVNPGNGYGLGFWGQVPTTYGITMANESAGYGVIYGLSEYHLYFSMTGGGNRGFVFRNDAHGAVTQIGAYGWQMWRGELYPGYNNATSGSQTSYYIYGNTNSGGIRTNGNWIVNSDIYLGTRDAWLSTWLNQDVKTSASPSFSTVNLNTLNASDTNARYYVQSTNGVPSNNLGNPTVTEMALFDEQFNNKTAFYNPASLTFWTSSDGTNYTEYTGFDTGTKKRFLGGDNDSGVFIPNLTNRFRIELENSAGYVFLNQLYIYWSSNSHSTKVHIWVRRCDNNQWYQWTDSNVQVSSWPGHLYLPFGGIPFYPGYLDSTGHYNKIRIEFIPSWSSGTYSYTGINLMRMQIWGGYPAGKRNIYGTDENQNVSFPATLSATTFSGALSGNATTATTAGALSSMNISQFSNNSGYITGYTETDTLATVTGRGATTASQVHFTKTDDHAIQVGTIRGRAVGSQGGEFIQLYERVNIGGPNGWGAANTGAPTYGLSVFGGANIGYGNSAGLTVTGVLTVNTSGTGTWGPFVVTSTSLWGDGGTQYVTIGAGGAAGIMIFNPHVVWNSNSSTAAIRLGRSGGVSSGAYYEIGTGASDNFFIAKNGASGSPQFNINTSGNATFSGTISASNLSGTNTGDQTNISGNAATATALTSMNISQFSNNSGYFVSSTANTVSVNQIAFSTTNYDFTLAPRLSIGSMSIKLWDNYFNNSGLGVDYGSLLDIYGRGGHVHSQFYMDASNALYYRSSPYAGGWNSWQQIWTSGTLTNLNQLTNGPGFITGYTETDTLNSVTGRGNTTSNSVRFGTHVDLSPTGSAFRFYDGTTFRGGLGLDSWGHSGSDANLVLYVNGDNNFFISTSGIKRAQFNSGAAIFRTYSADNAYNIRMTGGDQFNAYYNDSAATLYLQYHNGNGGTLNVGNGKLTVNTAGSAVASGDMRAPIFYDSQNTNYYGDFASTSVMNGIRFGTSANNATLSAGGDWGVRLTTDVGYIQFGPANSSYAHIYTDRPTFYFNKDILINNVQVVVNSGTWNINVTGSAGSAGNTATIDSNPNRTDGTPYPVVWSNGNSQSPNYSCAAVTIQSSTGTLQSTNFVSNQIVVAYANITDTTNGSTWYGLGNAGNILGTGGNVIQLAGWYGVKIKTSSAEFNFYSNNAYYNGTLNSAVLQQAGNPVVHAGNIGSQSVSYATTAGTANAVAWGNVSSKPSLLMYYQGFTLDANTMDGNSTGFTYSVNAPFTGPIARFSETGYSLQLNAAYSGGGTGIAFRTRNGDAGSFNPWRVLLNDANYTAYSPSLTGSGASGTWGINVTGSAGSVAWTNVSSRPTNLSQFTNDLGNYGGWITSSGSISGNAATATNVAWTGVTGRPTALSQFSNDLGNYGGWLTTGGKAADSELIDGIDSSRIVFGDGARASTYVSSMDDPNQKSGFFFKDSPTGQPFGDWWNWMTVAGNSWQSSNNYSFQIAHAFHSDDAYIRRMTAGTAYSWRTLITSGNIGSQSVSYANSAGSATTAGSATSASQLTKYGDIYGQDWNSYYISNKLIVSAALGMSGANKPPTSYDYGVALSYGEAGGPLLQMYFPENQNNIGTIFRKGTYRTGWNGNWSTWKTLVEQEGNLCTIVGGNAMGLEVHGNVGYNQDPLTYFLLRGQADTSWKALKIRLTGDAGGQDIEFRRIAENGTDSRMWYVPRGANTVNFDYPIVQPSDSRLKDNIIPISTPVDKIKSLRGVEFDWNSGEQVGTHDVGLIAQDVEAVLPEAVTTQEDGYKNLAYTKVIPLLVEAMKEQQAMIEALRAEIELLRAR